jgi:outer membrane protein assembly factor BamE (lipoprotein component of BamABCDE complex)
MTKKRRLVRVAAALAVCIAVGGGAILLLPERPCLNKANFDNVQIGMMRDEVERILGRPLGQEDRMDEG